MTMETPWIRARKSKSELQEQRLGKSEGGKKQVNSGRFWRWKRDGILYDFLIEARTTEKASYRIDKNEWLDIRKQAFQTPPGLLPGMQIDIQDVQLLVVELAAGEGMIKRLLELEALIERYERETGNVSELPQAD